MALERLVPHPFPAGKGWGTGLLGVCELLHTQIRPPPFATHALRQTYTHCWRRMGHQLGFAGHQVRLTIPRIMVKLSATIIAFPTSTYVFSVSRRRNPYRERERAAKRRNGSGLSPLPHGRGTGQTRTASACTAKHVPSTGAGPPARDLIISPGHRSANDLGHPLDPPNTRRCLQAW